MDVIAISSTDSAESHSSSMNNFARAVRLCSVGSAVVPVIGWSAWGGWPSTKLEDRSILQDARFDQLPGDLVVRMVGLLAQVVTPQRCLFNSL